MQRSSSTRGFNEAGDATRGRGSAQEDSSISNGCGPRSGRARRPGARPLRSPGDLHGGAGGTGFHRALRRLRRRGRAGQRGRAAAGRHAHRDRPRVHGQAHAERRGDQRSDRQRDQDRPPGPARREPGRVGSIRSIPTIPPCPTWRTRSRTRRPRFCRSPHKNCCCRRRGAVRQLPIVISAQWRSTGPSRARAAGRRVARVPSDGFRCPSPTRTASGCCTVGDLGGQFGSEFSPLPKIGTADAGTSDRAGQIAKRSIASTLNDALRTRPSKSESLDSRLKAPDVAKRHWYPSILRCVGTLIFDHAHELQLHPAKAQRKVRRPNRRVCEIAEWLNRVADDLERRSKGFSQLTASTGWPAEIPVLAANGSAEIDSCAEQSVAAAVRESEMSLPTRHGPRVTGSSGRSRRTACDETFGMRGILGGRIAVIGSARFPRERKREHRHWSADPSTRPPQHEQRVAAGAQPSRSVFVSLRPRSTRHHQGFRPGIDCQHREQIGRLGSRDRRQPRVKNCVPR